MYTMENSCKWHRTLFIVVVVCIVSAALAIVSYIFYDSKPIVNNVPEDEHSSQNLTSITNANNMTTAATTPEPPPILLNKPLEIKQKVWYPHCEKPNSNRILVRILREFHMKRTLLNDPGDPYRSNKDVPAGKIILYAAVTLLVLSLITAFLEVYKARKSTAGQSRGKPELSRRCSLADLTILRHQRRESMMRRESALHLSLDATTNHRIPPLKLLGTDETDSRRNSLPLASIKNSKWQKRSMSADEPSPETHHRIHMLRHH